MIPMLLILGLSSEGQALRPLLMDFHTLTPLIILTPKPVKLIMLQTTGNLTPSSTQNEKKKATFYNLKFSVICVASQVSLDPASQ